MWRWRAGEKSSKSFPLPDRIPTRLTSYLSMLRSAFSGSSPPLAHSISPEKSKAEKAPAVRYRST